MINKFTAHAHVRQAYSTAFCLSGNSSVRKLLYNIAGSICVGLAFLGLFLPLLPTTPFLLLAVFCFSRGSPKLHRWLLEHPKMGPIIRDWNERRIIQPRVKAAAAIMIVLITTPALVFGSFHPGFKVVSGLVSLGVIVMIWRRPSGKSFKSI
jgi:uncharacterized protein